LSFDEPVQEFGARIQEPVIRLSDHKLIETFRTKLANADAGWYIRIATQGYEQVPFEASSEHSWAFFPLYPLILGVLGRLTGEYGFTGSILSSLFFLLALVQLHRLAWEFGYGLEDAHRTIFYLAAFPTSYFFSLPFTESLFLLLGVSCFLAAKRDKWWFAGLLGSLAVSTRVTGFVLFPALAVLYWQRYRTIKVNVLSLLLIPAGIFPYMIFLQRITGNALAFWDVQVAWGHRLGLFLYPLWQYFKSPLELSFRWDFRFMNILAALLAFACGAVFLKRKCWALATFTLLCVILPLTAQQLQSLTRYTMVAFPIFLLLAEAGRSQGVDLTIRTVFLFVLGVMTLLFAMNFSMAMS
jgi:Gpi18-like mannosyltransferase